MSRLGGAIQQHPQVRGEVLTLILEVPIVKVTDSVAVLLKLRIVLDILENDSLI